MSLKRLLNKFVPHLPREQVLEKEISSLRQQLTKALEQHSRNTLQDRNASLELENDRRAAQLTQWSEYGEPSYSHDQLVTWNKNVEFLKDSRFINAYQAGMNSGHHILRPPGSAEDIHIEWRVAVICWAAAHARQLQGDFVECGVNTGIYSLAAARYIDFNTTGKKFWLFDTFAGIPLEQALPGEVQTARLYNNEFFDECFTLAASNFSAYPNAVLVRGIVPGTLATVSIDQVCYLSIDMNIAVPERAAIEYFWPKLVAGGIVVLDDYGWLGHTEQAAALNEFALRNGVRILTLPTGQGLLLKR